MIADRQRSDWVPGACTQEAILMFLAAEPPIEAVLVKGMPALAFRLVADDARVAQQGAVRTDRV